MPVEPETKKIGVVLFQLGGPDSLEAVEPFLYNLFCDPDIINFPGAFLARKFIAKQISTRRVITVAEHYREIGGKSPIRDLTMDQAASLETALRKTIDAKVFVAMRYWNPSTRDAIEAMRKEKFDKLVLLPLYPQYSTATTASSFKEWKKQAELMGYTAPPATSISSYQDHPLYIEAIKENLDIAYARFAGIPSDQIDIVFSAHGIPLSLVKGGDPYPGHIRETVDSIVATGQWPSPHQLCFQSKVGPLKWLRPSLTETIADLAQKGRKNLLIVPVAFVTEHIETLHEINIEARAEAEHLGISRYEMMPALNSHPKFIQCLESLVLSNC